MMEGWKIEKLENLIDVKGGKRLPRGEKLVDTPTPYPYLRVTDFENFSVNKTQLKYLEPHVMEKIKNYIIRKEDVFISIAGTIGFVGKIPDELDGANLTENAARLVIKNKEILHRDYLVYFLSATHNLDELLSRMSKNAQPKLSLANIKSFDILVPPLPEQRKIAHVLSTVQKAIEQQDNLIRTTTELKKALMQKLFTEGTKGESQKETEIGLVPESWEDVKMGECLLQTQYGLSTKGNDAGKVPILRMTNQKDGYISGDNLQYVNISEKELNKFKVNIGDVIFNRTNSFELVGRTAIFDLAGDYVFASYLIRLVTNPEKLYPEFLNLYLNANETQNRLKSIATRGVSQSNISATRLSGFVIPLPSLAEQKEIISIIKAFNFKINFNEKKNQTLTALFKTLLHELMTGQRRVHELEFK
jgi:type I restriction enzyme S subunit